MAEESKQSVSCRHRRPNLVLVALAEEPTLARHFQKILQRDNIHVVLRMEPNRSDGFRVALWVPKGLSDRAFRLLQSENALDSFYETLIQSPIYDSEDS